MVMVRRFYRRIRMMLCPGRTPGEIILARLKKKSCLLCVMHKRASDCLIGGETGSWGSCGRLSELVRGTGYLIACRVCSFEPWVESIECETYPQRDVIVVGERKCGGYQDIEENYSLCQSLLPEKKPHNLGSRT